MTLELVVMDDSVRWVPNKVLSIRAFLEVTTYWYYRSMECLAIEAVCKVDNNCFARFSQKGLQMMIVLAKKMT